MQETIADIYHAAAGTKPWAVPLTRMVGLLGLRGSQMVGISARHGSVLFSHVSDGAAADQELDYIRTYHQSDPRMPLVLASAQGQWVYDQDAFPESQALANPFYRDLLIPYGARYSACARLCDQDGEAVLIALVSRLGEAGFDDAQRQQLETLGFHLQTAAAMYQKTRRQSIASVAGAELLQRIARPAFLVAADRRLSGANARGRQFIDERGIFLLARGRLVALHRPWDDELSAALKAIDDDIARGDVPGRRMLRLTQGNPAGSVVLSLTPFVPKLSMQAFGIHPQVLAMVHESNARSAPDVLLWEVAFNLTAAQSRVALCLFEGRTTLDAAKALRVSESTVKSHLKEVFRKTGTSRQPQLVALLNRLQTI